MWYLSSETIAHAFFKINVPLSEKKNVEALSTNDTGEHTIKRLTIDIKNLNLSNLNVLVISLKALQLNYFIDSALKLIF